MRGRFIVLDGLDGCGKSTQMQHLSEWLPASGLMPKGAAVICTREPGGTELGRAMRELLLHLQRGGTGSDSGVAAVCGRPGSAC